MKDEQNEKSRDATAPTLAGRRARRVASFVAGGSLAVLLAVALSATTASAQNAAASSGLPACISVTPYARYIPYGYNQFVILKNGCAKAATCTVTTDVNPQPTTAEVPPGVAVDVLTYRASPAAVFVAHATCTLH